MHVWVPEPGTGPGVCCIQEIFGVGPTSAPSPSASPRRLRRRRARRVLAHPAATGRRTTTRPGSRPRSGMVPQVRHRRRRWPTASPRSSARRSCPRSHGGAGVIGFCLGGTLGYLRRPYADPACCVSYYGSGVAGDARPARQRDVPDAVPLRRHRRLHPRDQVEAIGAAIERPRGFVLNVEAAGHAFDNHEAAMFYNDGGRGAAWSKTDGLPRRAAPARRDADGCSTSRRAPVSRTGRAGTRSAGRARAAGEADVRPGRRCGHPATRRAHEQALLDEERLVHVLDRLGLLTDADGERRQPDRAAAELLAQGASRMARSTLSRPSSSTPNSARPSRAMSAVDLAVGAHLGEVAHPAQQPVGDAGRAPAAPRRSPTRPSSSMVDAEDAGRPARRSPRARRRRSSRAGRRARSGRAAGR